MVSFIFLLISFFLQIDFVISLLFWNYYYLSSAAGTRKKVVPGTEGLLCFEICNVKVVRLTEMAGYIWIIFISFLSVPQENLKEVSSNWT